jgi:hypothetical protein
VANNFLGGSLMNKHHFYGLILAISLTLILQSFDSALAQSDEQSSTIKNRGALYFLGDQDELLMRVNIWGFVRRPGQYMVPKDTDLISLISFAGGPREEAKIKKIKVIRNRSVADASSSWSKQNAAVNGAMHNGTANGSAKASMKDASESQDDLVYEVNVKKYLKTGDKNLVPELKPGDTIVVEGSTFHFVKKALDFTAKLAIFVNIYYLIQLANNR